MHNTFERANNTNTSFLLLKEDGIKVTDELLANAEKGDANALYEISKLYENKNDYKKAFPYAYEAAIKNHSKAQHHVGFFYQNGLGVSQDYKLALRWYFRAAKNGDHLSENNIGYMYRNGLGVPVDFKVAMDWYTKAERHGSIVAQTSIGFVYNHGLGVPVSYDLAMLWYLKAADNGNKEAIFNIARMYEAGSGVRINYKEAKKWYEKAADKGMKEAYTRIGVLYIKGLGVPKNVFQAVECFHKAAAQGCSHGQYYLGCVYEKEEEIKDINVAIKWYEKAVGNGIEKARKALERITKEEGYSIVKKCNQELQIENKMEFKNDSLNLDYLEKGSNKRTDRDVNEANDLKKSNQERIKSIQTEYQEQLRNLEQSKLQSDMQVKSLEKLNREKDEMILKLENIRLRHLEEISHLQNLVYQLQTTRENINDNDLNYDSTSDNDNDINYDSETDDKSNNGSVVNYDKTRAGSEEEEK